MVAQFKHFVDFSAAWRMRIAMPLTSGTGAIGRDMNRECLKSDRSFDVCKKMVGCPSFYSGTKSGTQMPSCTKSFQRESRGLVAVRCHILRRAFVLPPVMQALRNRHG